MTIRLAPSCIALSALFLAATAGSAPARVTAVSAERIDPGHIRILWTADGPVDLFRTDRADTPPAEARALASNDRDGRAEVAVPTGERPYFLLKDRSDATSVRVAERVLPLRQGSNFRDLGGYPAADGRHVRWGLLYRSGASAMLDGADLAQIRTLGLRTLVDLRSDEERVLAPTKIDGVPYLAIGYSMAALIPSAGQGKPLPSNGGALYRAFPTMLAPHLRLLFATLLRREGPVEYNCSAGQDRTGFASAMILSALGVPRATILQDYDLSTRYRQPRYEMPPIEARLYPGNAAAALFAQVQASPAASVAQPLREADGTPFLAAAFEAIEARWGSVDQYLEQEIGLRPVDIAALRAAYLE